MLIPEIVECKLAPYKFLGGDGKLYAGTEILMTDTDGRHYCSRTWDQIPDTAFMRAHQIEQFKKRMEAAERARG